jgi:hypothetical protein
VPRFLVDAARRSRQGGTGAPAGLATQGPDAQEDQAQRGTCVDLTDRWRELLEQRLDEAVAAMGAVAAFAA